MLGQGTQRPKERIQNLPVGAGVGTGMILLLLSCGDSATSPGAPRPPPAPPTAPSLTISITPAEVTFAAIDDVVQLSAEVRNQAGEVVTSAVVRWSSGNPSVASVDDSGLVTAGGSGTTTVRARSGREAAEARVTVMQVPTGLGVSPPTLAFSRIGDAVQLTAHFTDANGHAIPGAVSAAWSSADTSVATVDSTGLVTAMRNGSTAVTALLDSLAAAVSVNVADPSADREVLERLYHATGGDAWKRNEKWLTGAPLSEWFGVWVGPNGRVDGLDLADNGLTGPLPPELGDLGNLTSLLLGDNQLTGPLPPEIGKLSLLERLEIQRAGLSGPIPPELGGLLSLGSLYLSENDFSGALPAEIGNLVNLETLSLVYNRGLTGLFPRGLVRLKKLSRFLSYGTQLCAPIDEEFSRWLGGIEDSAIDECGPDQVERLVLSEFFDAAGGESWTRTDGWNSEMDRENWYGLTVEDGRVRSISLADNGLTGSIPGAVAGLAALQSLDLTDNDLAGQVPFGFGGMTALTALRISGNARLKGHFPFSMTGLTQLDVLEYEDTDLCIPPTPGFRVWLEDVDVVRGPLCENIQNVRLRFPLVYFTQAIQRPAADVPLVAGRDALFRAFLTSRAPNAYYSPSVVVVLYVSGEEVYRTAMHRTETLMATFADEGDLERSYNAIIPGEFIQPGLEFVVEADPEGSVPLADGSQTRYPDSGVAAVEVVEVPPMELTVVPVVEAAAPDSSIYAWTNAVADDSPEVGLLRYAFPFADFRARARETYATSVDLTKLAGQWRLVLELEGVRALSGGSGYWYGAAASRSGYVRGIARLGGRVSMGKPSMAELAHEVGHNLNLLHAPCGDPLDTDPSFPYRDGGLGAWGYDFRDGTVVSPETRRDIMGYCYAQGWLSDYFFQEVISYRDSVATGAQLATSRSEAEVVVIWGGVVDGELRIEPAFRVTSVERLPDGPGPYRVDGFAAGARQFSLSFTPGEDQFGNKYFFFTVPSAPLDRIRLAGPDGTVTIGADDERTISIVRDPASGVIRGILRDWGGDLPPALGRIEDLDVSTYRALGVSLQ